REALCSLVDGSHFRSKEISESLRSYLEKLAPVALCSGDHYRQLRENLNAEYPVADLQGLLDDVLRTPADDSAL
ncbi:MAG: hypothetical protein P1V97_24240, partial [Planctomycetota bacterium]|nr:hypothetical protein [Planctomycetota bacterium]